MFTSGSTVEGLVKNLSSEELKSLCEGTVIQSIGPSTSETIESYGIRVTLEAATHSIPSMIEDLVSEHRRNSLKRSS
jgi:uroporphyrinogen-III synthase